MELSVETLALAVLFLLPGYAAQRLTGQFSRSRRRDSNAFDAFLTALGVTVGILGLLALIAFVVAGVVFLAHSRWLDDLQLDVLVKSGVDDYLLIRPWVALLTLGVVALTSFGLAFAFGFYDPVGQLVRRRQLSVGIAPDDMWTTAFEIDPKQQKYRHSYLRIKIKGSGDVFTGRLRGISIPFGDNPQRDILLNHVTYFPSSGQPVDYQQSAKRSGALISSDDIESITVLYQD